MQQNPPRTIDSNTPTLILGTAMWGWTIPKDRCFALMDHFYTAGFREVDAATNYPINKVPADFRKSELILQEWIKANGINDLQVIMKVGSINNLFTPDHNLSPSFLMMNLDDYRNKFGANLDTFGIHWDNRDQTEEIEKSLEVLKMAADSGLRIGLSGIKQPAIYAALNQAFQLDFRFQMKHNLLKSDYNRYPQFHGKRRFVTYGINAGGFKLQQENYREDSSLKARGGDTTQEPAIVAPLKALIQQYRDHPKTPIKSFNHCGMVYAFHSPDIQGILLGTSRIEQLKDSIDLYERMVGNDYEGIYEQLKRLAAQS